MANVKPIPDGYSTVTPFLNIKGAAAAMDFYKKAFGAEERGRMAAPDGSIAHAEMKIGDSIIMISDAVMNSPTQASLHLYVENCDAAWDRAIKAGAKVVTPIADQFWGDRYGVLSDAWGNRWGIATHKEDISEADMGKRAAEAMKNMK
jgi:PhnB protein